MQLKSVSLWKAVVDQDCITSLHEIVRNPHFDDQAVPSVIRYFDPWRIELEYFNDKYPLDPRWAHGVKVAITIDNPYLRLMLKAFVIQLAVASAVKVHLASLFPPELSQIVWTYIYSVFLN